MLQPVEEFDYGNMHNYQYGQVNSNSFYLSRDVNFRTEFSNHWRLAARPQSGTFLGGYHYKNDETFVRKSVGAA